MEIVRREENVKMIKIIFQNKQKEVAVNIMSIKQRLMALKLFWEQLLLVAL